MIVSGNAGQEAPKFKTSGITKTEIYAVLTENEQLRIDRANARIDKDGFNISFTVGADACTLDTDAAAIGRPGFSYRDVLRTSFKKYEAAPSLDVTHPDYEAGWLLLGLVGLLDSPERVAILMMGIPIAD